jgi:hypothetical protein
LFLQSLRFAHPSSAFGYKIRGNAEDAESIETVAHKIASVSPSSQPPVAGSSIQAMDIAILNGLKIR